MFGSELEFYLLKDTYAEAHEKHYRDLTPSVPYNLDYHVLATTYDEPFIRKIRNGMQGAGIKVESSKGEAWPGQHEINFRFADAVTMADNHVIYKNGAKELAHLNGDVDHVHGEARPHLDRQLVPHPRVALARRRARVARPRRLRRLARRLDRAREGARGLPRAERELVQALRRRERGRRRRSPGGTTTGRAASASSATADRGAWRRVSRAAT